jgi:hypothetical protein
VRSFELSPYQVWVGGNRNQMPNCCNWLLALGSASSRSSSTSQRSCALTQKLHADFTAERLKARICCVDGSSKKPGEYADVSAHVAQPGTPSKRKWLPMPNSKAPPTLVTGPHKPISLISTPFLTIHGRATSDSLQTHSQR